MDVVFAMGIATIALVAMVSLVAFSRSAFEQSIYKNKASMLAREGLDGANLMGKNDFESLILTAENEYTIRFDPVAGAWRIDACEPNPDICKIDSYTRTIKISSLDAEQKKIIVRVTGQANKFLEFTRIVAKYNTACSNPPCPAP